MDTQFVSPTHLRLFWQKRGMYENTGDGATIQPGQSWSCYGLWTRTVVIRGVSRFPLWTKTPHIRIYGPLKWNILPVFFPENWNRFLIYHLVYKVVDGNTGGWSSFVCVSKLWAIQPSQRCSQKGSVLGLVQTEIRKIPVLTGPEVYWRSFRIWLCDRVVFLGIIWSLSLWTQTSPVPKVCCHF